MLVHTWGMFTRYPRVMRPVAQWAEVLDVLAAIIAASLIAVIYLNRVGPGRIVLALGFIFFVPGRAIVANWPRMARWSEAAIPVVISLAVTVLVATVSLWAHLWRPLQIFEVEAWQSLAALVFSIMRRRRLGLVWPGYDEKMSIVGGRHDRPRIGLENTRLSHELLCPPAWLQGVRSWRQSAFEAPGSDRLRLTSDRAQWLRVRRV